MGRSAAFSEGERSTTAYAATPASPAGGKIVRSTAYMESMATHYTTSRAHTRTPQKKKTGLE